MFDTEKLIILVQHHECIWNVSLPEYSNRDNKMKSWQDICAEMFPEWESLSTVERTRKGADLQKKWKNVKDCFSKEMRSLKTLKSGDSARKKKKYIFFDILQFLAPQLEGRRTESNVENSYTDVSLEEEAAESETPLLEKDLETDEVDEAAEKSSRPRPKRALTNKVTKFEDQLLQLLQANQNKEEDDDLSFFKSLLPTVRTLNETQKIEFKMEVLQALKKVKSVNTNISFVPPQYPYPNPQCHYPPVQPPYRQPHQFYTSCSTPSPSTSTSTDSHYFNSTMTRPFCDPNQPPTSPETQSEVSEIFDLN